MWCGLFRRKPSRHQCAKQLTAQGTLAIDPAGQAPSDVTGPLLCTSSGLTRVTFPFAFSCFCARAEVSSQFGVATFAAGLIKMALVYNFYIFDRHGECLFFREWNAPKGPPKHGYVEDQKLLFGLLFSLKQFVQNLSLRESPDPMQQLETRRTRLHIFETATGLRFVINTSKTLTNLQRPLRKIYTTLYVPHVKKNGLHPVGVGGPSGQRIVSQKFTKDLDNYINKIMKVNTSDSGSGAASQGSKSGGAQTGN